MRHTPIATPIPIALFEVIEATAVAARASSFPPVIADIASGTAGKG